jgi:hypothetical protein
MLGKISVAAALAAMLALGSSAPGARADEDAGPRRAYRSAPRYYGPEPERPFWWHLGYRPYRGIVPFGVVSPNAAGRVDVSCWQWKPSLFGGWQRYWACGLW